MKKKFKIGFLSQKINFESQNFAIFVTFKDLKTF